MVLWPAPFFAQCDENLRNCERAIERWEDTGHRDSLVRYLRMQLEAARACDSFALWAYTLLDIQDALQQNSATALRALEEALAQRWRAPAHAAEWEALLYVYTDRARHLFLTGRVFESLKAYRQADSLYAHWKFPDFDAVEYLYKPWGNHFTRLGDNEKALVVFQKALHLAVQQKASADALAGLYNNIGIAHLNQGEYSEAEKNLRRGLSLRALSPQKCALLSGSLASTCLKAGDAATALRLAKEALRHLSRDQHAAGQRSRIRATLGMALLRLQQPDAAIASLLTARTEYAGTFGGLHHRDAAKIEIALAAAWLRKGDAVAAKNAACRALEAVTDVAATTGGCALPTPAQLYAENTIAEALRQKAQAACLRFAQTGRPDEAEHALQCYDLIAQTYQLLRETYLYPSSKFNLQQTARACDEEALMTARLLYEKTGQQKWIQRALEIAERSKAAVLYETLRDNALLRQQVSGDGRWEEIHRLRTSLAWTERELLLSRDSLERTALTLHADTLRSLLGPLEQKSHQGGQLTALPSGTAPLSAVMGPDEHFLECFTADTVVHLFYGTASGPEGWFILAADESFRQEVQHLLHLMTHEEALAAAPASFFDIAYRLGGRFFTHLPDAPGGWLIIPDGWLTALPFEVLLTAPPQPATQLRTAPYLLRQCPVRYAWSLGVLSFQTALPAQASGALLALAPGFAGHHRGLAPISASGREWQNWPRHTVVLAEQCVRRILFENKNAFSIFHLATHATGGARPSIELWDETLFLPDLYALNLPADLVALSACETGTGDLHTGEGAMSLARAFACAGAKSVLATGWKAEDSATESIFSAFYGFLSAGDTKSVALQKAKLAYLDHAKPAAFCSPRFWAALTLTGDNSTLAPPPRLPCLLTAGVLTGLMLLLWWGSREKTRRKRSAR